MYIFEGADYQFGNSFFEISTSSTFLGPKILKYFVSNKTWDLCVFEGADYECVSSFSKFQPPVLFLAQFGPKI